MNTTKTAVVSALFAAFDTDTNLEKNGIVLQYGMVEREIDGEMKKVPIDITIARAGGSNIRYDKVMDLKTKPYKRMIQADSLDPDLSKQIMREVYAETVILGWNNVQNKEGEFVEFSKKNVIQLMTDLPDLFGDIVSQANKAALFRAAIVEGDTKN